MYRHKVIKELTKAINASNYISYQYKYAAHKVSDPELKEVLINTQVKRLAFKTNLQNEIKNLGREVKTPQGFVKTARTLWRNLTTIILYRNERSAISRVVQSEEATMAKIDTILSNKDLPSYVEKILRNYKYDLQKTIKQIQAFEDNTSVPTSFDPSPRTIAA